ncbi:hypothetical protein BT96DRAFT_1006144 [Gymnopus androsaceus JB14]|uniref:Uncharacterized protein n=1 Tax=Gymnopus androsaceus JB14 TaxID=1447944 RepID=A0A6A4GM27_9AGAR|nr:hypothetical protein BT96DRAFT_1006144 [Gymnopus androsaceus JB14]
MDSSPMHHTETIPRRSNSESSTQSRHQRAGIGLLNRITRVVMLDLDRGNLLFTSTNLKPDSNHPSTTSTKGLKCYLRSPPCIGSTLVYNGGRFHHSSVPSSNSKFLTTHKWPYHGLSCPKSAAKHPSSCGEMNTHSSSRFTSSHAGSVVLSSNLDSSFLLSGSSNGEETASLTLGRRSPGQTYTAHTVPLIQNTSRYDELEDKYLPQREINLQLASDFPPR